MLNFYQILYWILKWKSTETEDLSLELLIFFVNQKREVISIFSFNIKKITLIGLWVIICVFSCSRDSRVCVSEEVIFKQNTKFLTETTGTGLFCIVEDNCE